MAQAFNGSLIHVYKLTSGMTNQLSLVLDDISHRDITLIMKLLIMLQKGTHKGCTGYTALFFV